jgi:hypothetical protein
MSLLDILLNTRMSQTSTANRRVIDSAQPRIINMDRNGITRTSADTRMSSFMARNVVGKLNNGNVPAAMYEYLAPDAKIPFRKDSKMFDELVKAGIGPGSTMAELQAYLNGKAVNEKTSNKQTGSPMAGPGTANNETMVDSQNAYRQGYGVDDRTSTEMDYMQLGLNSSLANNQFQRLLHSSLFGN